ncbi:CDP-glucose 4,6-dehydratase [Polynucleobacter paneuropaeus]|jgi:CDP-glucose 4,6-dehydratase|uniref:CDP-glucose 4,6-dehydratase n=1 Tax=Polynucleobacter paneuropaeus TaxID=2527775 RepID=UPI001BFDE147|nr:CDP-glucose 4,6-dehydratase [Polynucleobacter paneuropaeus]MBT8633212.1 CDP-glucose 4,6-dehydratase [Polynucleobacter paneuropaeus]
MNLQSKFFGKTILVTGQTGFKGAWLTAWLKALGATVVGIALEPPTQPSHFAAANLSDGIKDLRIDIRDRIAVEKAVVATQPDFIFHLAAQSLVRRSYDDPLETWQTNVLGTLHVLEALRKLDKHCAAVIITSDKCYDNVEWVWGYRETDAMGGPDPYSASKGAAELAIRSHIKSYFPRETSKIRIASARAGNVIGGGDWAADRIVPDCVKAWSTNKLVDLRNPYSTRPWQHVLEPLSGYLNLAIDLAEQPDLHGEPFNFGPQAQQNRSVLDLVQEMAKHWDQVRWRDVSNAVAGPYESGLLKLNCDKSLHYLKWHAVMDFQETVRMTAEWYRSYYHSPNEIASITNSQIASYTNFAKHRGLAWAQ